MKKTKKILLTAMVLLASVGSFAAEMAVRAADTRYAVTLADDGDAHGTVQFTVGGEVVTQAQAADVVTVSVTPAEGYAPKDVTVRPYTSFESMGRPAPQMLNVTAEKQQDGTWQFTMPDANILVGVTYVKTLQAAWIQSIADQTYTGEAIEPTVTVKDGSSVLTPGTDYTVAYADNVDAGTATVTVKAAGSEYSGEATATFTILKADVTMTTAPEAVSGLVYSGEAQTLVTAGEASFGIVLYSLDGETFAETLPQATDAGTYTVYYKVEGDKNHNDFGSETVDVTIAKADITMTTAPAAVSGLVYSGEAQTLITAGESSFGTVLYSLDGETFAETLPQATDAGTYTVYYKVEGDENHNDFESETVSVTIATDKTALSDAIGDAEEYYESIKDSNPDVAATLLEAINAAKAVKDDGDATQLEIEEATTSLDAAVSAAVNELSGIDSVKAAADKDGNWYDLNGRRVTRPAKGLRIQNGKKIVVK